MCGIFSTFFDDGCDIAQPTLFLWSLPYSWIFCLFSWDTWVRSACYEARETNDKVCSIRWSNVLSVCFWPRAMRFRVLDEDFSFESILWPSFLQDGCGSSCEKAIKNCSRGSPFHYFQLTHRYVKDWSSRTFYLFYVAHDFCFFSWSWFLSWGGYALHFYFVVLRVVIASPCCFCWEI